MNNANTGSSNSTNSQDQSSGSQGGGMHQSKNDTTNGSKDSHTQQLPSKKPTDAGEGQHTDRPNSPMDSDTDAM